MFKSLLLTALRVWGGGKLIMATAEAESQCQRRRVMGEGSGGGGGGGVEGVAVGSLENLDCDDTQAENVAGHPCRSGAL